MQGLAKAVVASREVLRCIGVALARGQIEVDYFERTRGTTQNVVGGAPVKAAGAHTGSTFSIEMLSLRSSLIFLPPFAAGSFTD
jgi:hypothetical protein